MPGIRWGTDFGRVSFEGDIILRGYYERCSVIHQPLECRNMLVQFLPCSMSTTCVSGEVESLEKPLALLAQVPTDCF